MIDSVRYWLGVLVVSTLPAVLPYWFMIHGWPGFWRRLGKWPTLAFQFGLIFALIALLAVNRSRLMGSDLGFEPWLTTIGAVLYVPAVWLGLARRRYLTFGILAGLPEFAPDRHAPKLLKEGIYSRIRHPRYLEVMLGVTAWALFVNFMGVYVVVAACIALLLVIIPLEERELLERFGPAYAEYRRTVPMLLPARRARDVRPKSG